MSTRASLVQLHTTAVSVPRLARAAATVLLLNALLLTSGACAWPVQMHNAAAVCTNWREAFLEVVLGDTAQSRPER